MTQSFAAYGARRQATWQAGTPDWNAIAGATRRGYTGHTMLDNLNLIHMNGRVYDPAIGRFMSADPIADGLGEPGGFNRYAYVVNNPMSYVDPSGWQRQCIVGPCIPEDETQPEQTVSARQWTSWQDAHRDFTIADVIAANFLNVDRVQSTSELEEVVVTDSREDTTRADGFIGSGRAHTWKSAHESPQSQQPCIRSPDSRDFGVKAADFAVGFGDAFLIPIIVRNLAGIEGTTDYDSAAYGAGKITGVIVGLVPMALQGAAAYSAAAAARAAPSVLNANRYFRIGPGVGWGGTNVPRISSPFLPGDGHFPLTSRLPLMPPIGALFSAGGGCSGGN